MVEWVPVERDRLMRDWEVASDNWGRAWDRYGDPELPEHDQHPEVLWWAQMARDASDELAAHDRFAAWASAWLTARWRKRMGNLAEVW